MANLGPLNEKQEKFCQAYVLTQNGAAAAREAGYATKSASVTGYKLMKDERIKLRIEDLGKEMTTEIDVVTELEKQYTAAQQQGQGQVSLKALELLSRVRGNAADEDLTNPLILEKNIVRCLEILGADKVNELLERCSFD